MRHRISRQQFNRAQVGPLRIVGPAHVLQQVGEIDPVETLTRVQAHRRLEMLQRSLRVLAGLVLHHPQEMMGPGVLRITVQNGLVQLPRLG